MAGPVAAQGFPARGVTSQASSPIGLKLPQATTEISTSAVLVSI